MQPRTKSDRFLRNICACQYRGNDSRTVRLNASDFSKHNRSHVLFHFMSCCWHWDFPHPQSRFAISVGRTGYFSQPCSDKKTCLEHPLVVVVGIISFHITKGSQAAPCLTTNTSQKTYIMTGKSVALHTCQLPSHIFESLLCQSS